MEIENYSIQPTVCVCVFFFFFKNSQPPLMVILLALASLYKPLFLFQTGQKATLIRMLKTQPVRKALILGCGMQMFAQLSGINTVM